jgi:hypothetical protein
MNFGEIYSILHRFVPLNIPTWAAGS